MKVNELKEQRGVHTLRAHHPDVQTASRHRVGTSNGVHPEDYPYQMDERRSLNRQPVYEEEDDDAQYETRLPSSTRRYASAPATKPPPRTVMQVTRHQGPPPTARASRTQAPPVSQQPARRQREKRRVHVLVYIGIGMVCMVILWIALSNLLQWWQFQQDTWKYGMPRTFQIDADVKHGGKSHFTVENIHGHILIYEVQLTNLAKPHLYLGPVFLGAGADVQPATISFADVNGDNYPDMVIAVGTGRYFLINDHSAFRPVTSSDKISGSGV